MLLHVSRLSGLCRSLSTVTRGSVLEHTEYSAMRARLAAEQGSLGPLDTVCRHILGKDLAVNQKILQLNGLSLLSHHQSDEYSIDTKSLKKNGDIKVGRFTLESDRVIRDEYAKLVIEANVNEGDFKSELLLSSKSDRDFLLGRQLVGFYLLQNIPDGDHRMPVEVCGRLAMLLFAGAFTKQEDTAILAWVEEHGAKKWARLAEQLGRRYPNAGSSLGKRYQLIKDDNLDKKVGAFSLEEIYIILEYVVKRHPGLLEKAIPSGVTISDWEALGSILNRYWMYVYKLYLEQLHSTVRRHLAGTLEHDVREQLIEQVRKQGWNYSVEINYKQLADMPEFLGHDPYSLQYLYGSALLGKVVGSGAAASKREVTIDQVEEWWRNSKRRAKSKGKREREQGIVTAYITVMESLEDS